jgi:tetratricopeptide (TPR) repeat protein
VGRPVETGFFIRQFFLPEPADERGFLEAVLEILDGVEILWSYNGKCFDLPLLETRFRFWRMAFDRDGYGHVDLLTPTRALFRRRIGDCSLAGLEERILKVARIEDLPGSEVPSVYFEYLQTGRSPRLHRVFEHNRVDVLSLAVYASHLLKVFNPDDVERLCYPEDVLSLALYYFRRGAWKASAACLEEAREFALGPDLEADYHRLSGYLYRRRGEYERACEHFRVLTRSSGPVGIAALEELAKHYEHRRRDYNEALKLTDQAISRVERGLAFGEDFGSPLLSALHYRRTRLRRKLAHSPSL